MNNSPGRPRWMRYLAERSFPLVCAAAAVLIGAGPIVGGGDGTLVQTAGGDLLVGYGLWQARRQQSRRRDQEDRDDEEVEGPNGETREQRARRQVVRRKRNGGKQ